MKEENFDLISTVTCARFIGQKNNMFVCPQLNFKNWVGRSGKVFFFLAVFCSGFSGTKRWIYRIYMFVIHSASGNKDTNNIFKVQISFVSFLVLFKITIWAVSLQSDEANMTGIENAQCWHWHTHPHIPPVTFRCTYLYSLKYKTICFYI